MKDNQTNKPDSSTKTLRNVKEDTIAAISTPNGTGGIAVIRVSGPEALAIVDSAWKGKSLMDSGSHTLHLGRYYNTSGEMLDECVAAVFRGPDTFTGEDVVELSVHGSRWIQRETLSDLIRRGARVAGPGEFTRRAYLNGRLDLAQAEGVADLISASSKSAHSLALSQTRGHFSKALDALRLQLIEFASLLELELDFSEEDVEFADRKKMLTLSRTILSEVRRLSDSYSSGAVLKEGIPVVIAGVPNAGKSSLLNLLLNDDKAIVSDIPGTTRDIIEDTIELDGYLYRFIDTAGLRDSDDKVETIGIDRARAKMKDAKIVIWLLDPTSPLQPQQEELGRYLSTSPTGRLILLCNKSDAINGSSATTLFSNVEEVKKTFTPLSINQSSTHHQAGSVESTTPQLDADPEDATITQLDAEQEDATITQLDADPEDATITQLDAEQEDATITQLDAEQEDATITQLDADPEDGYAASTKTIKHYYTIEQADYIPFSTKTREGLDELKDRLKRISDTDYNSDSDIIVTNARHYEALVKGGAAIERAIEGIESGITGDFIAQDVREALHYLGSITGAITTPTLLQSIFSRFCIGK